MLCYILNMKHASVEMLSTFDLRCVPDAGGVRVIIMECMGALSLQERACQIDSMMKTELESTLSSQ